MEIPVASRSEYGARKGTTAHDDGQLQSIWLQHDRVLSACIPDRSRHRLASCNIPYNTPNMAANKYISMKVVMIAVHPPFTFFHVYRCNMKPP